MVRAKSRLLTIVFYSLFICKNNSNSNSNSVMEFDSRISEKYLLFILDQITNISVYCNNNYSNIRGGALKLVQIKNIWFK